MFRKIMKQIQKLIKVAVSEDISIIEKAAVAIEVQAQRTGRASGAATLGTLFGAGASSVRHSKRSSSRAGKSGGRCSRPTIEKSWRLASALVQWARQTRRIQMHIPVARGGFHAKGASISLGRDYVAVKINGNFPGNPVKRGLPTIQGAIFLADGSNGALLAITNSIEVTIQRTAAASALAAKLLARSDSTTLLICGCGEQGRVWVSRRTSASTNRRGAGNGGRPSSATRRRGGPRPRP